MLTKQRQLAIGLIAIIVAIIAIVVFVANDADGDETTSSTANNPALEGPVFSGERAYANAAMITEFGPHVTGSPEIVLVGNAIIDQLEAANWEVLTQEFEYEAEGQIYPVRNIIARRGEGPITILASHYDSRFWADNDPDPANHRLPVLGANDGASSSGVVLEFAHIIDQYYELNEQVWLVFFDAEDNGRIPGWDWIRGSQYMAENLEQEFGVSLDDFRLMILFDMVGEADIDDYADGEAPENAGQQEFPIESYSMQNAPDEVSAIWQIAAELGFGDVFPDRQRGAITDDHLPFIQRGIPAVDIIDLDYPYWHTVGDTMDKISPISLARPGLVVETYLVQSNIMRVESE